MRRTRLTAPSSALTGCPSPSVIESGSAKNERYRTNGPSIASRGPGMRVRTLAVWWLRDGDGRTVDRASGDPVPAGGHPGGRGGGAGGPVHRPGGDPVPAGGHRGGILAARRDGGAPGRPPAATGEALD